MEYPLVQIIHLFCAIIFIGFVFTDLFVLPVMKKVLKEDEYPPQTNYPLNFQPFFFPFLF